jgi:hypothetical protein
VAYRITVVTIVDDDNGEGMSIPLRWDVTALQTNSRPCSRRGPPCITKVSGILVLSRTHQQSSVGEALETVYSATTANEPVSVMFLWARRRLESNRRKLYMNDRSRYPGCLYNVSLGPTCCGKGGCHDCRCCPIPIMILDSGTLVQSPWLYIV